MGRAPCCEKVGLKRGKWTAEEDHILANYIAEHGAGSWRSLPKNAGLLRCGKSCRLRWINYLRPGVKRGNISKEEEDIIIKLHATLGRRWSHIASQLHGRTDNEIKNYWNSHLSRQIHTYRRKYTAGPDTTASIDKRHGGRTPCQSPKSASSSSETKSMEPDAEPEAESGDAKGASTSPATAATTKSMEPDAEPEAESGDAKGASTSPATAATTSAAHSDGARRPGSGSEVPSSEDDATGPWILDTIDLEDLWNWEIDGLVSTGAGHDSTVTPEGFDAVGGEAQVDDDLFDIDWDGLEAYLRV